MELLDRYLQAVQKHLPWQRQEDIVAELRANLEAQLEDKEAELGRPLTQGEAEDWLRELGEPARVAARYQPERYLIGPVLFSTYWFVLRLTFLWVMVIYVIVNAVQIASQNLGYNAVVSALIHAPLALLTTAAWVTAIFAAIEFFLRNYPSKLPANLPAEISAFNSLGANWSPSALPPVEASQNGFGKPRSYFEAVVEVVAGYLCLIWLLLVPHYPFLLLGPGALYLNHSPFQFAPVWVPFYWCVVAINVLQLAWQSVNLARGQWRFKSRSQLIVVSIVGLIPQIILLTANNHAYVFLKHPLADQLQYGQTVDTINAGVFKCMTLILVITILQLLWNAGRKSVAAHRKRIVHSLETSGR